jgi:hypothetical protein
MPPDRAPVTAEQVAIACAEYVRAKRLGKHQTVIELRRARMEALAGRFATEQKLADVS